MKTSEIKRWEPKLEFPRNLSAASINQFLRTLEKSEGILAEIEKNKGENHD